MFELVIQPPAFNSSPVVIKETFSSFDLAELEYNAVKNSAENQGAIFIDGLLEGQKSYCLKRELCHDGGFIMLNKLNTQKESSQSWLLFGLTIL